MFAWMSRRRRVGPNTFEQQARGFVVGVLPDEFAPEGFGLRRCGFELVRRKIALLTQEVQQIGDVTVDEAPNLQGLE